MITYQQAYNELSKVVADAGLGTVYEKPEGQNFCSYTHRDAGGLTPGCVIGHWLHAHHRVSLNRLCEMDKVGDVSAVLAELGIAVTRRAACFLWEMQGQQDRGVPWGNALEYARGLAGPEMNDDRPGTRGPRWADWARIT